MKRYFTSESVTEGHPDKICDQISDAILDAYLALDPTSRVACEVAITTDLVLVMGEISSSGEVDIEYIVRKKLKDIGYANYDFGFDYDHCQVMIRIDKQSADISQGVDTPFNHSKKAEEKNSKEIGAGDQGMMFGFACKETETLMPLPIELSHRLTKRLTYVRKQGILDYLGPDGKSQVTVEYHKGKPLRVDTVVISAQHLSHIEHHQIELDIKREVIDEVIGEFLMDDETKVFINPTGKFVIGGPVGDSGLTGRKIIVDTYGGYASHGGGAFSGKDPTKVDRSGAYMARYVAKNIVASGLADQCEIELAYAIGVVEPVSVFVNSYDSSQYSDEVLGKIILSEFDLTPHGIIDKLNLQRPIYGETSAYGHFGRDDLNLPWEKIDKAIELKEKYLDSIE